MIKLLTIGALLLTGCILDTPGTEGAHHTPPVGMAGSYYETPVVVIDASYAACPEPAISEAIAFWRNNGASGLDYTYSVPNDMYGIVLVSIGTPKASIAFAQNWAPPDNVKLIQHSTITMKACHNSLVLAHELGHALGFDHSPMPRNIMSEDQPVWGLSPEQHTALQLAYAQTP